MRYITGQEKESSIDYMTKAAEAAMNSSCERARCGSVIVKDGKVIGEGWNSPPGNLESQRRCSIEKSVYNAKVTDKTCCVHAEQRAIIDALSKEASLVPGSTLYFARLTPSGGIETSGDPYCTICSKMALDVGIKEFVLWQTRGLTAYAAEEYNDASFKFPIERWQSLDLFLR